MVSFNDPIAELLTRLRNAAMAQLRYVDLEVSKMRREIVRILKEKGYISNFLIDDKLRRMRIFLKYTSDRRPVISGLKRVSSPGLRRYGGWKDIPRVYNGIGMAIISTSQGIMDDTSARRKKVGGEILCFIW